MSISMNKILNKIEEELKLAKGSHSEARIRERVHAIKALCELALDEEAQPIGTAQPVASAQPVSPPAYQATPQQQVMSVQPSKKLKMNDEANGDSLFDF